MMNSTLKNANILIVDDQQANIDVLTSLLELKEYTNLTTTIDSRLVVTMLKDFNPDLILLDLMMPHLDGFQILEQLKDIVPAGNYLPILVLTADVTPDAKQIALAGGASDFLSKPFDLIEVDLRIKNLLKTRYLHQQLENQNQILEEKVKERTKELEEKNKELIEAKVKVDQSDKLKSEFLHQISLEMRTPTNAVLSFTNLLREEMMEKISPDLLEYFDGIDSAGQSLIRTVDLVLNVSGMQESLNKPVFCEFDVVKEIINKIIIENRKTIEDKGLLFKFTSAVQKVVVTGDKDTINQIFVNLLGNSIKYTKAGDISIIISKTELGFNISIEDTGIGISEEFIEMMYHPAMEDESESPMRYEGKNLGFALVKKYCDLNKIGLALIKKHCDINGIVIKIESNKGVGTKFTLVFTESKVE
ncbi:MAG: hybrid sensor histidine kinase/response regulator [Ignavibacteria bacterium]|nr:hybrid sensor histidine kinase/response regulator [Ignavibacteria bacterium]